MTDKVQKIREEVERLRNLHQIKYQNLDTNDNMCLVECGKRNLCNELLSFIDSLQEESVSIWHDASKEPDDMSHCLIFYGCKESVGHYLHYEPVLYNKKEKVFMTSSFPHPTGYKVEQKSFDGGCVAEVYKDRRDRISISDITQWCYLYDLHNLQILEKTEKCGKEEPVSEDFEKAAKIYSYNLDNICGSIGEQTRNAFKAGAEWGRNQAKVEIQAQSMALAHGCPKESITEELEKAAVEAFKQIVDSDKNNFLEIFKAGAQWQKEQMMKHFEPLEP